MTGIGMILKSLGVKISDAHITQLEVLLPQIPTKAQEIIAFLGRTMDAFNNKLDKLALDLETRAVIEDARYEELHTQMECLGQSVIVLKALLEEIQNGRRNDTVKPATGTGSKRSGSHRSADTGNGTV